MRPRSYPSLVLLLLFAAGAGAQAPVRLHRFDLPTMGTMGSVTLVAADSAAAAHAAEAALRCFVDVDARLSNWDPRSELSRANADLGQGRATFTASVRVVVDAALRIASESQGAFDPTVEPLVRAWGFLGGPPRVPDADLITDLLERTGHDRLHWSDDGRTLVADVPGMKLDLGGIAKGHAVDRAVEALRGQGIEHALVDLSGNMRALGTPPGRPTWTLGVRDPDARDAWFARLDLHGDAVATSGNYEQFVDADGHRYGHVLDPRRGWPVEGLDAVTVLAPDAMGADAWATALLVLGPDDARAMATRRTDLHAILVHSARDGRRVVWVESSLADRFALVEGARERFDLRWF